ncbi:MAG: hypothetical protein KDB22_07135 [Planctomycetales bacterium]|nr:hypothetical protein [Planctomycetales bacterium]
MTVAGNRRITRTWRWPVWIALVGLLAFGTAAAVSWRCPFVPRIHDEFSQLLSADTLLHGRMANPRPEVWQPLQSFHIIMNPSYASKYPLGPGLLIAAGIFLLGSPVSGCWFAACICSSSICWMLAGVTNRRWAIFGGLLVAVHPAMQTSWSATLMSGWLTAAASALVLGALLRLRRRFSPIASVVLGMGVAMLALTRPYEGLVYTIVSAGILWCIWHRKPLARRMIDSVRISCLAIVPVGCALAITLLQNQATTGHWTRMPYQVHEQTYGVAPLFIFQHQRNPSMSPEEVPGTLRDYHYGWSLESYTARAGFTGWLLGITQSLYHIVSFWGLSCSLLPLAARPWSSRFRLLQLLFLAIVIQIMASSLVCWVFPHYLAPILPWLVVLSVIGLKHTLHSWKKSTVRKSSSSSPKRERGIQAIGDLGPIAVRIANARPRALWRQSPLVCGLLMWQLAFLSYAAYRLPFRGNREWAIRRHQMERQLLAMPGQHLVLVHYLPDHSFHEEWVYNRAAPAEAAVLWAHGEREEWNQQLISMYGQTHQIWHAYVGQRGPKLIAEDRLQSHFITAPTQASPNNASL